MADALWLEGETVVQFEIVSNCDLKKQNNSPEASNRAGGPAEIL